MSAHPYDGLPDHCFWKRAVTWAGPGGLDPVVARPPFTIEAGTRVATIGSCFSQHLAQHLTMRGVPLFTTEPPPAGLPAEEARRRNYGAFSVRAGNVYTLRQAVQLFDRAFGSFRPREPAWSRDSRVVDPFRPTIEPDGFDDDVSMERERERHLSCVRELFETCDVLVMTLGITEGWRSAEDGAMFPLAPGAAGGPYCPGRHEFVRFSFVETAHDLRALRDRLLSVNPGLHLVFTVSPVPLAATFTREHVCVASMQAKSVLRAAVGELAEEDGRVTYFPSYEIVTGFGTPRSYYADDLRHVTDAGVRHVMRVFERHHVASAPESEHHVLDAVEDAAVVCDEDWLEPPAARVRPQHRPWWNWLRRRFRRREAAR